MIQCQPFVILYSFISDSCLSGQSNPCCKILFHGFFVGSFSRTYIQCPNQQTSGGRSEGVQAVVGFGDIGKRFACSNACVELPTPSSNESKLRRLRLAEAPIWATYCKGSARHVTSSESQYHNMEARSPDLYQFAAGSSGTDGRANLSKGRVGCLLTIPPQAAR